MSKRQKSPEDRAPFTREEIIFETRRAALAMASLIAAYGPSGEDAAGSYLGISFDGYNYDDVSEDDLNKIPIEKHFLYRVVMDAYDYAYQVGSRCVGYASNVDERQLEVAGIYSAFPHTDFYGENSPLSRLNDEKLLQVVETFLARYDLDNGSDLTVRGLAQLANMGEAAVRTSISAEGIKTVAKYKGKPGVVPHSDAVSWLMGRRGFSPSASFAEGGDTAATMRSIFTAKSLGFPAALDTALIAAGLDLQRLAEKASVPETWLRQVATDGAEAEADLAAIQRVAEALQAPVPTFAGKAIEYLLAARESGSSGR